MKNITHVYVLEIDKDKFYIGHSTQIKKRLISHQKKKPEAKLVFTHRTPFPLQVETLIHRRFKTKKSVYEGQLSNVIKEIIKTDRRVQEDYLDGDKNDQAGFYIKITNGNMERIQPSINAKKRANQNKENNPSSDYLCFLTPFPCQTSVSIRQELKKKELELGHKVTKKDIKDITQNKIKEVRKHYSKHHISKNVSRLILENLDISKEVPYV